MQNILFALAVLPFFSCKMIHRNNTSLVNTKWIHGSSNCRENTDPPIQIVKYNSNTYIFRQNKCIHYEAPFLFLFIGNKKALLMDTGATEDENQFPLYTTVKELIDEWEQTTNTQIELIVAHTHNHNDHTAGDVQFKSKSNTMVVGVELAEVQAYFKLDNWPFQNGKIDLGKRIIEVIPIPGHEKASIAVYDYETKILLSGDSFYPGRLYINDWPAYRLSIQRLVDFTNIHKPVYILGNHIEMTTKAGQDYPAGTVFQPEEQVLPLQIQDLTLLNNALKRLGAHPVREVHDRFIIYPK